MATHARLGLCLISDSRRSQFDKKTIWQPIDRSPRSHVVFVSYVSPGAANPQSTAISRSSIERPNTASTFAFGSPPHRSDTHDCPLGGAADGAAVEAIRYTSGPSDVANPIQNRDSRPTTMRPSAIRRGRGRAACRCVGLSPWGAKGDVACARGVGPCCALWQVSAAGIFR